MLRIGSVVLLTLVCAPAVHAGEWHVLDGKQAPEITAATWLNREGGAPVSRAGLEGRVWLLQFMAIH